MRFLCAVAVAMKAATTRDALFGCASDGDVCVVCVCVFVCAHVGAHKGHYIVVNIECNTTRAYRAFVRARSLSTKRETATWPHVKCAEYASAQCRRPFSDSEH